MLKERLLSALLITTVAFLSGVITSLFLAYQISSDLEEQIDLQDFNPYFVPDIDARVNLRRIHLLEEGDTNSLFESYCMQLRTNLRLMNHATFDAEQRESIVELVERAEGKLAQLELSGSCAGPDGGE